MATSIQIILRDLLATATRVTLRGTRSSACLLPVCESTSDSGAELLQFQGLTAFLKHQSIEDTLTSSEITSL